MPIVSGNARQVKLSGEVPRIKMATSDFRIYTKCKSISDQNHLSIMPMYRNSKDNRVCDPELIGNTFLFLHSVSTPKLWDKQIELQTLNYLPFLANEV
jgi:hypothetical protein